MLPPSLPSGDLRRGCPRLQRRTPPAQGAAAALRVRAPAHALPPARRARALCRALRHAGGRGQRAELGAGPPAGDCNYCGGTGAGGFAPTPGDVDGDGIPNYIDTDSDNDGISDADENKY